jgi:WhiB family redox-sensing transcriptional regulator
VTDTIFEALAGGDRGWMERAACAHFPTDRFFPSEAESSADAVAVCEGCPVRLECLDYALRHRLVHGVWGATTEVERKRMLRSLPTKPAA